ncbi:hypothetical protein PQO03_21050 [Lentisphaera profundi]|uniref:RND efflux pump membrane fusion protein barrel-sandwich domain-containing protein n=1 Tax=Lentisphaera profundi TaxID=1658616 RepID=A0ABY7VX53_9BACT|nr:HlyD family efflux transporter periplasmic adaptor subunit [Lentisphaera profundi]WDE98302.1 hypothetical protein PQO03_21050 [Lentisphaera profundi]
MRIPLLIWLFLSFTLLSNTQVNQWKPHKHPAKLQRLITGFTEPCKFLELKAEYPSRLINFELNEGDVLKGPNQKIIVAKQDTTLVELELKASKAALESQKQNSKTQHARAELEKRHVKYRKLEMDRIKRLSDDGKIAKSNFDRSLYEYDEAQLKLIEVNQNIALQNQVITEAEIKIETVKEKLKRHYILGPKGWVLNSQKVEAGTWLNANDEICQLVDIRQLSINFRLSQEEYEVLIKDPIQLSFKKQLLKSKIHRSDLSYDPVSRKRHVELRIDSKQLNHATGGLEVKLEILVDYPSPAVLVPHDFMHSGLEQSWLINNKNQKIIVQPLRRDKDFYIIKKSEIPIDSILIKAK